MFEVVLSSHVKHQTGTRQTRLLWTGLRSAKPWLASPNSHRMYALLWDIMQHRMVFLYQQSLQLVPSSRVKKSKRENIAWPKLTDMIFFVWGLVHHLVSWNSKLLKYLPENKFSPKIVTGKWLLKNKKLTTRLKNKTWPNSQSKNPKKCHELRLIRPQTWHKIQNTCV